MCMFSERLYRVAAVPHVLQARGANLTGVVERRELVDLARCGHARLRFLASMRWPACSWLCKLLTPLLGLTVRCDACWPSRPKVPSTQHAVPTACRMRLLISTQCASLPPLFVLVTGRWRGRAAWRMPYHRAADERRLKVATNAAVLKEAGDSAEVRRPACGLQAALGAESM